MSDKILVVDDEALQRRMIGQVLERRGFQVMTAVDGRDALKVVADWLPDLVITDISMPELDGFGFVKALRALPQHLLTAVIFLSAQSEAENRVRGFKMGADDFLPKPFYPDELFTRIDRCLERLGRLKNDVQAQWQAESPAKPRTAVPDLDGDLETLGIATILHVISDKSRSGVLSVTRPGENALLEFANGRVVAAQLDELNQSLTMHDAIYKLLTWETGRFVFKAMPIQTSDQIQMSHEALLLEAARRIDEAHR